MYVHVCACAVMYIWLTLQKVFYESRMGFLGKSVEHTHT